MQPKTTRPHFCRKNFFPNNIFYLNKFFFEDFFIQEIFFWTIFFRTNFFRSSLEQMNTKHSLCTPITFLFWKIYPSLVIVLLPAFCSPKYFRIHFFLASKMQYVWQSANTQYGKYANWNRWERVPNEWHSLHVWPNVCMQLNFLFNSIWYAGFLCLFFFLLISVFSVSCAFSLSCSFHP